MGGRERLAKQLALRAFTLMACVCIAGSRTGEMWTRMSSSYIARVQQGVRMQSATLRGLEVAHLHLARQQRHKPQKRSVPNSALSALCHHCGMSFRVYCVLQHICVETCARRFVLGS